MGLAFEAGKGRKPYSLGSFLKPIRKRDRAFGELRDLADPLRARLHHAVLPLPDRRLLRAYGIRNRLKREASLGAVLRQRVRFRIHNSVSIIETTTGQAPLCIVSILDNDFQ